MFRLKVLISCFEWGLCTVAKKGHRDHLFLSGPAGRKLTSGNRCWTSVGGRDINLPTHPSLLSRNSFLGHFATSSPLPQSILHSISNCQFIHPPLWFMPGILGLYCHNVRINQLMILHVWGSTIKPTVLSITFNFQFSRIGLAFQFSLWKFNFLSKNG